MFKLIAKCRDIFLCILFILAIYSGVFPAQAHCSVNHTSTGSASRNCNFGSSASIELNQSVEIFMLCSFGKKSTAKTSNGNGYRIIS
jgi:hypothetical protein